MKILPNTHFLNSIRADRGSYSDLSAEAIDNSIDADASEMSINLSKDAIVLEDDGIGITKNRETAIVTLGEHGAMATTMLGRFGIGLKYHAVSAGNTLEVDSLSRDGRMRLIADWDHVIKSGVWEIKDPKWTPKLPSAPNGTHIWIRNLRWAAPTNKDVETTRDKLAQIFYPALIAGKTIIVNDKRLPILQEPEMTDVVEGNIRLSDEKGAHVRGGIMKNPGKLYYVQVSYKHRVIMPQSVFGCGEYTGLRRMFARVDLTGPWGLSRFKNAIADNDADELDSGVLDILRPILEKLHGAQMNAVVDEMTDILNRMLPEEMVAVRPPKNKERRPEPIEPSKKKDERHGRSDKGEVMPRGPARKPKTNDRLLIDFEEPLVEEYGYGHFIQPGKTGRIILAKDNPHIANLLSIRDKEIGAQSLFCIAMMIYMHDREIQPGVDRDLFAGPFGKRVWTVVERQPISEQINNVT